jgi:hypothetical protein
MTQPTAPEPDFPTSPPFPPTGPQLTQPRPGDESNPTPYPPPTPKRRPM